MDCNGKPRISLDNKKAVGLHAAGAHGRRVSLLPDQVEEIMLHAYYPTVRGQTAPMVRRLMYAMMIEGMDVDTMIPVRLVLECGCSSCAEFFIADPPF